MTGELAELERKCRELAAAAADVADRGYWRDRADVPGPANLLRHDARGLGDGRPGPGDIMTVCYPLTCDGCGRFGTVDDAIAAGEECPECGDTIRATLGPPAAMHVYGARMTGALVARCQVCDAVCAYWDDDDLDDDGRLLCWHNDPR